MDIRYSKSTGVFYPLDIDYSNGVPDDCIIVDMEIYTAAMNRPAATTFDIVDNQVVVTDAPAAPYEPQRDAYMTTVRDAREKIIIRVCNIGWATDDADLAAACKVARQNLLDITKNPGILAATNMDDLKAAVLAAYRAIVESVPADIKNAFNEVDA